MVSGVWKLCSNKARRESVNFSFGTEKVEAMSDGVVVCKFSKLDSVAAAYAFITTFFFCHDRECTE